jgi:hypothetical protein
MATTRGRGCCRRFCLIVVGCVKFSLAPLAGRASVVATECRGEGVGRGVPGAGGDLRRNHGRGWGETDGR